MNSVINTQIEQCIASLAPLYEADLDNHEDLLEDSPVYNNFHEYIRYKKWDALGEILHWATGSPGPTEYAAQEKNFLKIKKALEQQYEVNNSAEKNMN